MVVIFSVLFPLCLLDHLKPVHDSGEDSFKAVGIAAVMEKAGCPIPPDMQELVERACAKRSIFFGGDFFSAIFG